jgi:hypothetical protein
VVKKMPAGDYIRFLKSARMIFAETQMVDIQSASFHTYKESDRSKIIRELKSSAKRFLFEPLLDFQTVAMNLAKRLKANG